MIEPSWKKALEDEIKKPYFQRLQSILNQENVYPSKDLVFSAFWQTPLDEVKAVVLGQDPYHNPGQAHGLAFSVPKGTTLPPSLKNIYKELAEDLEVEPPICGCLLPWAKQGVLLLNTILTVEKKKPMSHRGLGWERFTDQVIEILSNREKPVVFALFGNQKKFDKVVGAGKRHPAIRAAHPSPLSARKGFFGSRPFSKINKFLNEQAQAPINWIYKLK